MDWRTALVTVRLSVPVTPPVVACTVKIPVATPVASPVELTIPTAGAREDQVTVDVNSTVLPSEYVPVAASCKERPRAKLLCAAVTVMVCRDAVVTVSVVLFVIEPRVAVIVDVPTATAVSNPVVLTVPTEATEELHETADVMLAVLPSV
jgi:hypothetical protein